MICPLGAASLKPINKIADIIEVAYYAVLTEKLELMDTRDHRIWWKKCKNERKNWSKKSRNENRWKVVSGISLLSYHWLKNARDAA
jgi:hypothetical protein